MSFDITLFDLPPFGLVPLDGSSPLQSFESNLYLLQVSSAARENMPLTIDWPALTASLPQAGSMIFSLQSRRRSSALSGGRVS